jgi:hypothetical protein
VPSPHITRASRARLHCRTGVRYGLHQRRCAIFHVLSCDWVNVLVVVVRYTGEQGLQSKRHEKRGGVHLSRTEIACCCTVQYSTDCRSSDQIAASIEVVSHVRSLPNDDALVPPPQLNKYYMYSTVPWSRINHVRIRSFPFLSLIFTGYVRCGPLQYLLFYCQCSM